MVFPIFLARGKKKSSWATRKIKTPTRLSYSFFMNPNHPSNNSAFSIVYCILLIICCCSCLSYFYFLLYFLWGNRLKTRRIVLSGTKYVEKWAGNNAMTIPRRVTPFFPTPTFQSQRSFCGSTHVFHSNVWHGRTQSQSQSQSQFQFVVSGFLSAFPVCPVFILRISAHRWQRRWNHHQRQWKRCTQKIRTSLGPNICLFIINPWIFPTLLGI